MKVNKEKYKCKIRRELKTNRQKPGHRLENRQFRKEAVIEEVDKTKFKVINEIYNFKRKSESEKQNVKNN